MKGIILSGGTGSRLRPITHTGPKQLVPIANKAVLEYAIDDLREAGIDDIAVILGNTGRGEIQKHLGDGRNWGVDITYVIQGEPLGLAHAVGCARDFVGQEPFVVYLGDNMMREGIGGFVSDFNPSEQAAAIGLQRVDEPSQYGVVDVNDEGAVTSLIEKPENPPSDLALIGIYLFTPEVFDQIEKLEPSWRGELEITEAIQGLLDDGHQVQSHVVEDWWKDTGKPEDVLHANRLVLDDIEADVQGEIEDGASVKGRVQLGEGSTVDADAVLRGPISIGKNTHIGPDSYVGPYTSIGDDCEIEGAHVESSIIIGESIIRTDRTIVDSLLGRNVSIRNSDDGQPRGERMVLGENSTLDS